MISVRWLRPLRHSWALLLCLSISVPPGGKEWWSFGWCDLFLCTDGVFFRDDILIFIHRFCLDFMRFYPIFSQISTILVLFLQSIDVMIFPTETYPTCGFSVIFFKSLKGHNDHCITPFRWPLRLLAAFQKPWLRPALKAASRLLLPFLFLSGNANIV